MTIFVHYLFHIGRFHMAAVGVFCTPITHTSAIIFNIKVRLEFPLSYDEVAQKIGDLEQAVMENTNLNQSEFKNEMLNLANELIDKARDLSG